MSLRRMLSALCLLAVLGITVPTWGEGWAWLSPATNSQQQTSAAAPQSVQKEGVQKDDSQLTVVNAKADDDSSIVDTAVKKKKSFWDNKVFHPTKWFSKK